MRLRGDPVHRTGFSPVVSQHVELTALRRSGRSSMHPARAVARWSGGSELEPDRLMPAHCRSTEGRLGWPGAWLRRSQGGHVVCRTGSLWISASVAGSRNHTGCTMSCDSAWSHSAWLAIPTGRGRSASDVSVWFTAPPTPCRSPHRRASRGEGDHMWRTPPSSAPLRHDPPGKRQLPPPLVSRRCAPLRRLGMMTSMQGQRAANSHDDPAGGHASNHSGSTHHVNGRAARPSQDPRSHFPTRSTARTEP